MTSPYNWPGRPRFGLLRDAVGQHAVVLSWHVAPDFSQMAGQDRMLAIWAEPLLDALAETGARVTLLLLTPQCPGPADATPLAQALRSRGIGLHIATATDTMAQALAVDRALVALAPDLVHAPERGGLLACALARRAAGLAHLDTTILLHARGPVLFQMEEQSRFIGDPGPLLRDEMERQAMRLADHVLACGAEVARAIAARPDAPALEGVAPVVWPVPTTPSAALNELVFPLPLGSEAGLEFAVAVLSRAAARRPFPLPVTFLGQPDAVTLGDATQALAGLGERVDWQVLALETPQQALQYLAAPGRLALFTAARALPPEWLEFCGAAGIPALATENLVTARAARRWPCIRVLPRAERPFAAALAALPALPEASPAMPPPPAGQAPRLTGWQRPAAAALALLAQPASPDLTLICPPRGSLLASLAGQGLDCFATTILLPEPEPEPDAALPTGTASRPFRIGTDGLAAALAACETRFAVLCGEAVRLRPAALLALRRAALAGSAPAIAAWDSASAPLGGGADLALLRPGGTIGHLVLLDLPALRARGGRCLALAGTRGFAGALAEESGGVMMLPEILADAAVPPPLPGPPALAGLPARLRGVAGMALHYAAEQPRNAEEIPAAMTVADRRSGHYLKLIARLMERSGQPRAAAEAWAALVARGEADSEVWYRHVFHNTRRHGRVQELDALLAHIATHGLASLQDLPAITIDQAAAMRRQGRGAQGFAVLLGLASAFQDDAGFIAALAAAFAGLPPGARAAVAWPALRPASGRALQLALAEHGLAEAGALAP